MFKPILSLTLLLPLLAAAQQQSKSASREAVTVPLKASHWTFQENKVEFTTHQSRPAMKIVPAAGPVVLKDMDFTDGTIELDYEPLDSRFASLYFHWQDARENECFYFRTSRAGNPNAPDAVQYAPHIGGVNLWDVFGQYQSHATFAKNAPNHVKLVISGKQMRVYVNSETKPTLQIPRLEGNITHGTLAFEGEAIISNLVVRPGHTEGLCPVAGVDLTDNDPRYIRNWQVSQPAVIPKGIELSEDQDPKAETVWQPIEAERMGLVNLTRKFGKSETRRIVWLKTSIKSETAQQRRLALGFSNEVWVVVNGQLLYVDKNYYAQPIMKEPQGRLSIENTSFTLPLNQGDNELLIGVANDFFGWGIAARLDNMTGISFGKEADKTAKK